MLKVHCIARNEEGQEEYTWPDARVDAVELCDGQVRIERDGPDLLIFGPVEWTVRQESARCLRVHPSEEEA